VGVDDTHIGGKGLKHMDAMVQAARVFETALLAAGSCCYVHNVDR